MNRLNYKRIALGAIAGAVVWSVWTSIVTMKVLLPVYKTEIAAGRILGTPRYGLAVFFSGWFVMLLVVTALSTWLYATLRPQLGAGIKSAVKVGAALGLIAAVPIDLSVATWSSMVDTIPLTWAVDAWVGLTLATCVAAFIYKDAK
ncbi:MAG TPA: hypothetical protein VGO35_10135 [Gammaproteobacteria bacterium]|jgi:hypothetical protein|nr:hypothetical protein [Gammaproteobacteria bacterium]